MRKTVNGKEIQFMDIIKWVCTLAIGVFLLPACGKTDVENPKSVPATTESDFEYQFVAESENGYYFWECINQERLLPRLLFMDRESGRVVPLCNRPNCNHEGEECNAYYPEIDFHAAGIYKEYLQYYEGSLYAVGLSEDAYVSVFSIKEDGSEWELSTKLYRTDYAVTGHWKPPELLIDGGYIYFVDWYQAVKKLERIPIGGRTSEIVFEGDCDVAALDIYRIRSKGGLLFFQVMSYSNEVPENVEGGLYCYDPEDGQCSLVKGVIGPYSVQGDYVYYTNDEGLCCYSMRDGTMEILVDQRQSVPNITTTEDYMILCDQKTDFALIFYDYEGKELAKVENTIGMYWYFGGNAQILFGRCMDEVGMGLCFLDLTRPLDELEWEELKAD